MSTMLQSEDFLRHLARGPGYDALDADAQAAILDATGCPIVAVELGSGLVVAVNATAEAVSGMCREEWLGRHLWDLADPAHEETLRAAFDPAQGAGIPRVYEVTIGARGRAWGESRRVLWSSEFVSNQAGVRTHVVLTGVVVSGGREPASLVSHMMRTATEAVMIGTDRHGRVTFCSAGAEQLLGFEAQELMGRSLPMSIFDRAQMEERAGVLGLPADLTLLSANLVQAERRSHGSPRLGSLDRRGSRKTPRCQERSGAADTELQRRDWTLTRRDGREVIASIAVSRVTDRAGQHIGFVGIAHDVTEQRMTHQLLVRALEKETAAVEALRLLDQAKSDFVSNVSHELRTPVTSIVGYTEMLDEGEAGELTPAQAKLLGAVRRNSGRLMALVDNLLALASSQAGTLVPESVELDLRGVIAGVQELLTPIVLNRRLSVAFELPDAPVVVLGDAQQLERVVLNLVNNAIKFTEDGGDVTCRLSSQGEWGVLEVSDSGIGIPIDEQGGLFTRFFRASSAQTHAIQGTGLGLTIVADIVETHGGDISVHSEPMQGSTFTVRIPTAPGTRR